VAGHRLRPGAEFAGESGAALAQHLLTSVSVP
jgi:hypothetical protein